VIRERGRAPGYLRSDHGLEFLAQVLLGCLQQAGVQTAYIAKGKPWQNGYAESFHNRFRDEFLNGEVFLSVVDAPVRAGVWRCWYNDERPHSSSGYQMPREFAVGWQAAREQAARTNMAGGT
jgi:putative transposase